MARCIAIVEDEPEIRANYSAALRRVGFEVEGFADRPSANMAFSVRLPDLVLIDVGLGDELEGGFELCRELRARSSTLPIIFLTARDSDLDTISGLRLGADDYLTKDVSMPHLVARINTLFRRMDALRRPQTGGVVLEQGALTVEVDRMVVRWLGQVVPLTVTEFWMVHAMARHPGHVKTRDQLMGDARVLVDESTITSHIKRIRKKFLVVDADFDAIDTVHGAGYRWNASP